MKKVGIVTITNGHNYGNRLQNYALQETITKINCNVQTLKNNSSIEKLSFGDKIKFRIKMMIKYLIYPFTKDVNLKRQLIFNNFNKENINFSKYKISNKLNKIDKKINEEYDFFCCGSDQIWNPSYEENAEANFLQFTDRNKRIAYAPSIAVSKIPEERKEEYKNYFNSIDVMSIREDEGANIIKELTGKDVPVLLDPTMLLEAEDWKKIEKKPKQLKNSKYILNYFLGELSDVRKKEIERIAVENGCEIINILDKKSPFYLTGPSEFLYLERNAFLICTDSFHSSVFAILYNRPFIVFSREDKTVSMNSRIETLIKKFDLKNRKFENIISEDNLNHDYSFAYTILEKERKKSLDFLRNALNIGDKK